MSDSSGAFFPGFGSEEICNLPAREIVTGTEELPQATLTLALTDPDEVLVRQASSVTPLLGEGGLLVLPLIAGGLSLGSFLVSSSLD